MAQNETRSLQLVFLRRPLERRAQFSLSCPGPGLVLAVERLGYINLLPLYNLTSQGMRAGWHPDPVLSMDGSAWLEKEQWAQPLLLSIKSGKDCQPGLYAGSLTLQYLDKSLELPIKVRVLPLQMPDKPSLPLLLGVGGFSGETGHQFWLNYRMNPHYSDSGNIYDRRLKNTPLKIDWLQELSARNLNIFNLIYLTQLDFVNNKYNITEEKYLNRVFRIYNDEYMQELQRRGLSEGAVIYSYDEVSVSYGDKKNREIVESILGPLRERYSKYGVRIAATLRDCNDFSIHDMPVDIWIPLGKAMSTEAAAHLRSLGKEVWWYHIGWEIWHPVAWTRSVHWTSMARGYQGWLYYNVNGPWSKKQQLGDSALTNWGGFTLPRSKRYGTGSLVYEDEAGRLRPSLRLVNFREGMYDYDLLFTLRQLVKQLEQSSVETDAMEEGILQQARQLLSGLYWGQQLGDLCDSPAAFSQDQYAAQLLEAKRSQALQLAAWLNTALQKRQ